MRPPPPLVGAGRWMAGVVVRGASRLRPQARELPAWDRGVIDDVAAARPWNLVVKAARQRALRRVRDLEDGVTVIIVSWNTAAVLADVLTAVRALSPPGIRVLVVDNHSTDGSRPLLEAWPGIDVVRLPANAGHGVALDLGICATRTRVALTLDSDAIPLRSGWLDPAVEPVASGQVALAGLRASRGYVHPVYLAVDVATFIRQRLSFQVHRTEPTQPVRWGENAWDTGELMVGRLPSTRRHFIEESPSPDPALPGICIGGVVYHHGGVARGAAGDVAGEGLEGWRGACRRLGLAPLLEPRWGVSA